MNGKRCEVSFSGCPLDRIDDSTIITCTAEILALASWRVQFAIYESKIYQHEAWCCWRFSPCDGQWEDSRTCCRHFLRIWPRSCILMRNTVVSMWDVDNKTEVELSAPDRNHRKIWTLLRLSYAGNSRRFQCADVRRRIVSNHRQRRHHVLKWTG